MEPLCIDSEIIRKLRRMRELNAVIEREVDYEQDVDEYVALQYELLPVFEPLVCALVNAGLLTVSVDLDEGTDYSERSTVTGDPHSVFPNGNLWISGPDSGGTMRKKG
jgi:hypothetical protein